MHMEINACSWMVEKATNYINCDYKIHVDPKN